MRRIWIVILLCAALGPSSEPQVRQDHPADRAAIQAPLDAHGAAWTKGDAAAAAAVMTEDADWVSGSGAVYEGRPAIEAMHRRELAGMGKGSRHSHPGTPKIRFIRPDVALVDGDSYIAGLHDEQGTQFPPTTSRYTAVMVNGERTVDGGGVSLVATAQVEHQSCRRSLAESAKVAFGRTPNATQ